MPVIVVNGPKGALDNGRLADVAPTMLDLMGIPAPAEMTGASLIAKDRESRGVERRGLLPGFEQVSGVAHALVREQYATLNEQILPALAEGGIHLLRHHDRDEAQRAWAKEFFERGRPAGFHPGFDEGAGCALYDCAGIKVSLYDWELEHA